MVRTRVPVVGAPVRTLPQEVVLPRGPAGVPSRGYGSGAGPRLRTWAFLLDSRPAQLPGHPTSPPTGAAPMLLVGPPPQPVGAPLAQDPGADLMVAHRHADTLPLGNRQGKRPRTSSRVPPAVASLFLPRPDRPAATPAIAYTTVDTADDVPDKRARPGPHAAAGSAEPGVALVTYTPRLDTSPPPTACGGAPAGLRGADIPNRHPGRIHGNGPGPTCGGPSREPPDARASWYKLHGGRRRRSSSGWDLG